MVIWSVLNDYITNAEAINFINTKKSIETYKKYEQKMGDGKRNIQTIEIDNRLNYANRQRLFRTNETRQFPFSALKRWFY